MGSLTLKKLKIIKEIGKAGCFYYECLSVACLSSIPLKWFFFTKMNLCACLTIRGGYY